MQDNAYEHKAQYYETDCMGVVHHSNYIRWFEEARVSFMENVGLPYDKMERDGMMLPVLSCECTYKRPVKFGEVVVIRTTISEFSGVKVVMNYVVEGKDDGEIKVTGSSSHCFTDTSLKPIRIKHSHPDIYERFETLCRSVTRQDKTRKRDA